MMTRTTHSAASLPRRQFTPNVVSLNMANAMVGRNVDLLVSTRKVTHGVVTGVLTEAGKARIVVGRATYDLSQGLTVSPA
jgi:hypothetical protein